MTRAKIGPALAEEARLNREKAAIALQKMTETKRQLPDTVGNSVNPEFAGVSIRWLAHVFRMHESVVERKLRECPVKSRRTRGTKMESVRYDIATAAAFLVRPSFSTMDYLKALKRNDLPAALQQTIWDALLKRQKWEEQAGMLWRTDKVREVLGSTFQTMKFTMQLWVDTLERQTEMTDEQRALVVVLVDELQNDLYEALVQNAEKAQTGSQIGDLKELVGEDIPLTEAIMQAESNPAEEIADEDLI